MKKLIATITLALCFAIGTSAQTTHTNCTMYGNTADCTSTTHDTNADMGQAGRDMGTAIGTIIARSRASRAYKNRVETNIIYCEQNPDSSIILRDGTIKTCSEAEKREVAFCTLKPKDKLCKFFAQHRAEKTWAQAVEDFKNSPAGSDWPGGDRNRDMMGQELQSLNLVDAKDKVAALTQAYAQMKATGMLVPSEAPVVTPTN